MVKLISIIRNASWTSCFFCWVPIDGERQGACERCRADAIPASSDDKFRAQYLLGRRKLRRA